MKKVLIGKDSEINNEEKRKISFEGRDFLIVKNNNTYYAVDNKCPHMGGSLYDGDLEGTKIKCPRHGSIFDVASGEVVQGGKLLFINLKVKELKKYEIKKEEDEVYILI